MNNTACIGPCRSRRSLEVLKSRSRIEVAAELKFNAIRSQCARAAFTLFWDRMSVGG